jgi:CBS domain containing-hemolysin-like protein
MTPRLKVQAISIAWTLEETMKFIAQDGHSRYPVVRNSLDELVGILLVKDILAHIQKGAPGSWTRAVRRPYFVSELATLGTILRDMKRWGTHLALVRNETGVLTGLLTLEDLIEEIVGEIRDEHDDPVDGGGDRAMGGPSLVSGEIPILDFNERYQCALPMDVSYSTLNGYLLSRTGGQIPPVGTMIFGDDVTFRIHSVSESGIATVQVIDTVRQSGSSDSAN